MAEDDDVAKALAFLRKKDVERSGAFAADLDLSLIDPEDPDSYREAQPRRYEPVGPNWKRPGSSALLPKIVGHPPEAWLIHERQDANGKYKAWLFFSTVSGDYYCLKDRGSGFMPMNTPHNPIDYQISVRVGNASVLSGGAQKLDMAVLLPDLAKTGFLIKQPLEFLDKPASLFVLCTGLRNTAVAAEFCAKRFHTVLMPKLSSRATEWSNEELTDLLKEAIAALDALLLDSPACFGGCCFAVALLIGRRLAIGALGKVRCILCRPRLSATTSASSKPAEEPLPWFAKLVGGGDAHTMANKDERFRIETEDSRMAGCIADTQIHAGSVPESTLAAVSDEWERELLRVRRAANSFAALGITAKELKEGASAVRRSFRRRSLLVHPDKALADRRERTTAVFSKLEAASAAVEAMLQADAAATAVLAEIHAADDNGRLSADPAVAAKLLQVPEGSDLAKARAAAKKIHLPLSRLEHAGRQDVERAMKLLDVAAETVARGTLLWTPAESDKGVSVTRALGCKDLKKPTPLLTADLAVEIVNLDLGEPAGLALVAEGAEFVTDPMIASRVARHAPGRPRAAALRIALDAAEAAWDRGERRREAVSVVVAMFNCEGTPMAVSAAGAAAPLGSQPPAKRLKTGKPERVRMSHILLRWPGLKGEDEYLRPEKPPPTRTQAEAEKELLELAEQLLAAKQPKTLAARFKAEVLKRSECSTALNVPHADLGWMEPGGAEPSLELAAFATPLGGLSDVVVTSRGAHIMYRLA